MFWHVVIIDFLLLFDLSVKTVIYPYKLNLIPDWWNSCFMALKCCQVKHWSVSAFSHPLKVVFFQTYCVAVIFCRLITLYFFENPWNWSIEPMQFSLQSEIKNINIKSKFAPMKGEKMWKGWKYGTCALTYQYSCELKSFSHLEWYDDSCFFTSDIVMPLYFCFS